MKNKFQHITLVGIDGIGKTTIVQKITETKNNALTINSPAFHESPHLPSQFQRISRLLDKLSLYSDQVKNYNLKGVALFLQISLFSPIEKELLRTNPSCKLII